MLIDGEHISGSPANLCFVPDAVQLERSELTGEGLSKAVVGKKSIFRIRCKDRFGNLARPGPELRFELALLLAVPVSVESTASKKKEAAAKAEMLRRMREAEPLPHETDWHDTELVRPTTPLLARRNPSR